MVYRHGVVIRIFPSGHISDTRNSVVAMSQSASSFSFSLTANQSDTHVINNSVSLLIINSEFGCDIVRVDCDDGDSHMTIVYVLRERVNSIGLIPSAFDFIRCSNWLDVNFFTK